MAKDGAPDDGSGPRDVQITIVVVPGRVRATLTRLLAGVRVRAALATVGLVAAVATGTTIAVLLGAGSVGRRVNNDSPLANSGAAVARFGLRLNCPRVTVVSPDGAYARIDFEPTASCGTFGNHVTLILHRVQGAWVREFEASGWTCPISELPQAVVVELQLCRRAGVSPRRATPSPRSPSERSSLPRERY